MSDEKGGDNKHDWTDSALKLAVSTATTVGKNFVEGIHAKIDRAIATAVRSVVVLFMVMVGLVFLLVGLAQGIGEYFDVSYAIGYIAVGVVMVIVAGLVNQLKRR